MAEQYIRLRIGAPASADVADFIRDVLEWTLRDVHDILRLPLPKLGITSACNFAIVNVLLNEIGGIATVFFDASGSNKKKYVGLLSEYYPWDSEALCEGSIVGKAASELLYDLIRNPFTHSLGMSTKEIGKRGKKGVIRRMGDEEANFGVRRLTSVDDGTGLTPSLLQELEGPLRPRWLNPTLELEKGHYVLCVEALYRGVRDTIERLSRDRQAMAHARLFLKGRSVMRSAE